MSPSIFICPGIYEGPAVFEPLASELKELGYQNVRITSLRSTGTSSNDDPAMNMDSDAAAVAKDLTETVEEAGDEGVVAVLHSAGGFLCGMAMKGLTAKERAGAGKKGGVVKIVLLTPGLLPEGTPHKPLPFMQFDEEKGIHYCKDPRNNLFNDLSDEDAAHWQAKVKPMPSKWDSIVTHCGWQDVPSVFVLTTEDKMIPPEIQEQLAVFSGSEKVVRLEAGHMLQLSKTKETAQIIADFAGK